MANNKQPQISAKAKNNKSILIVRVVFISNKQRVFIRKHCYSLIERNPMLLNVQPAFIFIPFECKIMQSAPTTLHFMNPVYFEAKIC